jgi:hypothetical protein
VDVESPCDGADRLSVADEFPGELLLVRAHLLGPAEGDAARFGGYSAIICPADNERALKLGDACVSAG